MPLTAFLLMAGTAMAAGAPPSSSAWTALLQQNVRWVDGGHASRVDYAGMKRDRTRLDTYAQSLSAISPAQFHRWNRNDQMAFLINAYNTFTVKLILTRWPQLSSIKDLGSLFSSPWKKDSFILLGQKTSLDHLESLLRTDYHDPRIHFAINCASIGCPALRNDAYDGAHLDSQLADAARRFLGDHSRNRYDAADGSLHVSKIFDWYANDFQGGKNSSVKQFLAAYAAVLSDDTAVQKRLRQQQVPIDYLPYNWKLNGVGASAKE